MASVQSGRGTIAANVTGYNSVGSIGVQVNVPLYTGGSIQNRIRETLVLEERSRNDLEAARRAVTQTTRQAYYTLQSGAAHADGAAIVATARPASKVTPAACRRAVLPLNFVMV